MPTPGSTAAQKCRARVYVWLLCMITATAMILAACASGDRPLDEIDPASVTANPTYDQVFAIIDRECVSCHQEGDGEASDATAATAALLEDDTNLSDCVSIVAQRENIWDTIDNNTMPPGALPRLSSEERLIIRRWIDNGAPAPCN